jgi:hypothetical protein
LPGAGGLVVSTQATSVNGSPAPSASPVANEPPRSAEIQANAIVATVSPQAASVVEAVRTGKHPERLSPLVAPTPWDRAAFERDPDAYLRIAEPGRALQAAPEGEGVPMLDRLSERVVDLPPGGETTIVVRTEAGMPCSALSTDLGRFGNGLPYETVRADGVGEARFTFTATPGTVGEVNIQIASPVASRQAHVTVQVAPPPELVDANTPQAQP